MQNLVEPMAEDIVWVGSPAGRPPARALVTVYGHRGRVSVNPNYGCPLGCAYCVLAGDGLGDPTAVTPVGTVQRALEVLCTHREAVGDLTVHLFDHSDPFLPENASSAAQLVEAMALRGFTNQVSLTSKVPPAASVLARIAAARGPAVTVYTSLADPSGRCERVSPEARVALARLSHAAGLRTVLLLRPVHPAWTDLQALRPFLRALQGTVDEVVLTGLRVDGPVSARLQASGYALSQGLPGETWLDPDFATRVALAVDEALPGVPLSRRRSCASNRLHRRACHKRSALPRPRTAVEPGSLALLRDGQGYCRVGPQRAPGTALSAPQAQALEALALRFATTPVVRWAVDGGAARALLGEGASSGELEVRVHPEDLGRARERALETAGAQRCCSGNDSWSYRSVWSPPPPPPPPPPRPEDPGTPMVEDTERYLQGADPIPAALRLHEGPTPPEALSWVPLGSLSVPVWDPQGRARRAEAPALLRVERLVQGRRSSAAR